MIPGVAAQEYGIFPRGTLVPRLFNDTDTFFGAISSTDRDKIVHPGVVDDLLNEQVFGGTDLPKTLTPDLVGRILDDLVPRPLVAKDQRVLPLLYTSNDIVHPAADIRVPGYLLPSAHDDDDIIYSTPLILDPGMWRVEAVYVDIERTFPTTIAAPLTMWAVTVNDVLVEQAKAAQIYAAIAPRLMLHDDVVHGFSTTGTGYETSLFIDDARPVTAWPTLDGVSESVTLTNGNLTAIHNAPVDYAGARSTMAKSTGKWYFEVNIDTVLHGARDCFGLSVVGTSYQQLSSAFSGSVALYVNYGVPGPNDSGQYVVGPVITNNAYYTTFDTLVPGDVIGVAVDLDMHLIWFRKNGGHWNNDYYGITPLLNQNPSTGYGFIPVMTGQVLPIIGFGGYAGTSLKGQAGDTMSINFGEARFAYDVPVGYQPWRVPSPFAATTTGDRFGQAIIAVPATWNSTPNNTTMTNGNLTATKVSSSARGIAYSTATQNWGKFYFEVNATQSSSFEDAIGLTYTPLEPQRMAISAYSAVVFPNNGNSTVWVEEANTGVNLGRPMVDNDIVGIAVDLTVQTLYSGGSIWFRLNGGPWNNDLAADPEQGIGAVAMPGFSYVRQWVPAVTFGSSASQTLDTFTANFGAAAFAWPAPEGFSPWPNKSLNYVQALNPDNSMALTEDGDDVLPTTSIDSAFKVLFHTDKVNDDFEKEVIFQPRIVGGTLFVRPGFVQDAAVPTERIFAAGYYGSLGGVPSPTVALSNFDRTATLTSGSTATLGARSENWRATGRIYFEVQAGPVRNSNCVGVMNAGGVYTNMAPNTTNCSIVVSGGTIYSNNAFGGNLGVGITQGDIVCVALDLVNRKIWFRKNALLWNGDSFANPANGTGGINVGVGAFAPVVGFQSGATNDSWTCNFGSDPFTNPVPSGFVAGWPGGAELIPVTVTTTVPSDDNVSFVHSCTNFSQTLRPALLPTDDNIFIPAESGGTHPNASLDGAATEVAMSNANLTATHTTANNNCGVRSTALKSTGKFYFEVTLTNSHGSFDCGAILSSAGGFFDLVSNGANCMAVYKGNGNIYSNNQYTGRTLGACAIGDVLQFAVDIGARLGWVRKNGGNWNGLVITSANPATGIGGVTLNATVSFAPAVGFGGSGTAVNDVITANFGDTAYANAAPAGFLNWQTG